MFTKLPTTVRVWLRMIALAIGLVWLGRIVFTITYPQFWTLLPADELFYAWLTGLRFDFATALMTVTIPFLLLWWPMPKKWFPYVAKVAGGLLVLAMIITSSFIWGDNLYYAEAGHHVTFEVKGLKHDIIPMLKLVFTEYPIWAFALIGFWYVQFMVTWKLFRPLLKEPSQIRFPRKWWGWIVMPILTLFITVFGIRGGFQLKPLRMTFAFHGDNVMSGHLALNGWYTFVSTAFATEGRVANLMPNQEAFNTLRELLKSPTDTFLDEKFPIYRQSNAVSPILPPGEKNNVVLLVVESLTAAYLGSFGGTPATMPYLDSLASQSLVMKNCYAIGTRSMEGVSAVLASIPNLMGAPYMGSTQEQTKIKGLGTIFKEQGYQTKFIHAALPGSMNIMQMAQLSGYDKFYHLNDFPREQYDGHWGTWDRYVFRHMNAEMDTMREPFHYGVFTMSTHSPYITPPDFTPPFPKSMERANAYNTFANLDVELRAFFKHEQQQPRFNRTIYVIIGDHTSQVHSEGGTDDRFRIGCLIYAPGRVKPAVIEEPTSQLDLVPTMIQLCGFKTKHGSFGRSVLDTNDHDRFAYFTFPGMIALRDRNGLLINNLEHDVGLYGPRNDYIDKQNRLPQDSVIAKQMRHTLYSFYQTAEKLLNNNRILPLVEAK